MSGLPVKGTAGSEVRFAVPNFDELDEMFVKRLKSRASRRRRTLDKVCVFDTSARVERMLALSYSAARGSIAETTGGPPCAGVSRSGPCLLRGR